ncbi:MAG: hypothetical protein N2517_05600 [Ignavibacteria bacterium]|nr:hypothetical protein [Ignavibacteria bacterium]
MFRKHNSESRGAFDTSMVKAGLLFYISFFSEQENNLDAIFDKFKMDEH